MGCAAMKQPSVRLTSTGNPPTAATFLRQIGLSRERDPQGESHTMYCVVTRSALIGDESRYRATVAGSVLKHRNPRAVPVRTLRR